MWEMSLIDMVFDYLYTLEDGDNSVNAQQLGLPDNTDSLLHK